MVAVSEVFSARDTSVTVNLELKRKQADGRRQAAARLRALLYTVYTCTVHVHSTVFIGYQTPVSIGMMAANLVEDRGFVASLL